MGAAGVGGWRVFLGPPPGSTCPLRAPTGSWAAPQPSGAFWSCSARLLPKHSGLPLKRHWLSPFTDGETEAKKG